MIVALVFIFGAFIGSFLNVVIFRLHRQESFIKGTSKCLFCGHRLMPLDLMPILSYFYLRGHCRYCRQPFSKQYPLVEFFTALIFVLVYLHVFPDPNNSLFSAKNILYLMDYWALAAALIVVFVYDFKYYLILDTVIWPATVLAITVNLFLGYNPLHLLYGAIIGGGFFALQFAISRGRWIGGGDIRLGMLMGVILGWPYILAALFIAYVLGSLISVILILYRKKAWHDKIPFGTFLALSTLITMLYGPALITWYWSLFIF